LHPSNCLRIDFVILGMGAEKPDRHGCCAVLDGRNQSIVVALDVENDPAGLENACFGYDALTSSGCATGRGLRCRARPRIAIVLL
jgi:hypothetical protein